MLRFHGITKGGFQIMEVRNLKAHVLPLALGLAFLAAPTAPALAHDSVQSVLERMGKESLPVINQKRAEYNGYAKKAKGYDTNLIGSSNLGSFSDYGRVGYDADDLLPLMPAALIDDVNRKILNEYYRGY